MQLRTRVRSPYANNEGSDPTAHPRTLGAFTVRLQSLDTVEYISLNKDGIHPSARMLMLVCVFRGSVDKESFP